MRQTWIDFFSRERQRLIAYVRSQIEDAADRDGEDILQDVIAGILDKADVTAPIQNIAAYAYQALRNRVIDYLRRRKKHDSIDTELSDEEGRTLSEILADVRYDSAKESQRKEINRDLNAAIGSLDEDDRDVFIATELQGVPFQELSELWEVPVGTLLSRKSRAARKLRKELVKIDHEHYSQLLKKG